MVTLLTQLIPSTLLTFSIVPTFDIVNTAHTVDGVSNFHNVEAAGFVVASVGAAVVVALSAAVDLLEKSLVSTLMSTCEAHLAKRTSSAPQEGITAAISRFLPPQRFFSSVDVLVAEPDTTSL